MKTSNAWCHMSVWRSSPCWRDKHLWFVLQHTLLFYLCWDESYLSYILIYVCKPKPFYSGMILAMTCIDPSYCCRLNRNRSWIEDKFYRFWHIQRQYNSGLRAWCMHGHIPQQYEDFLTPCTPAVLRRHCCIPSLLRSVNTQGWTGNHIPREHNLLVGMNCHRLVFPVMMNHNCFWTICKLWLSDYNQTMRIDRSLNIRCRTR